RSPQPPHLPPHPPPHFTPIPPLKASVRDLTSRFVAAATCPPPPPPPPLPQPRRQPPPPPPPPTQPPYLLAGVGDYPATYDPDIPWYCTETHKWYGNPSAFAVKYPSSWEAQKYNNGGYPDNSDFTPGHLDPEYRPPQPSYAAAASSSEPPNGKWKGKANGTTQTTPAEI